MRIYGSGRMPWQAGLRKYSQTNIGDDMGKAMVFTGGGSGSDPIHARMTV